MAGSADLNRANKKPSKIYLRGPNKSRRRKRSKVLSYKGAGVSKTEFSNSLQKIKSQKSTHHGAHSKTRFSKSIQRIKSRKSTHGEQSPHGSSRGRRDTGMSEKCYDNLRKILHDSRNSDDNDSMSSDSTFNTDTSISDSDMDEDAKRSYRRRKAVKQCPRACCKKRDSGDGEEPPGFYEENLPAAVIAVANRMKESAFNRKKEQTKDNLNGIMHRITMALHHSGNDVAEVQETDELTSQEIIVYGMPDYDIEREREKRDTRQKVMEIFSTSMKTTKKKIDLITDLEEWLSNLLSNQETDDKEAERLDAKVKETDTTHRLIMNAINKLRMSSKKLGKIGKEMRNAQSPQVIAEKLPEKEQSVAVPNQDKNSTSKRIFTAQELNDKKNWQMAAKKLVTDLEEVTRSTHDSNRKALQNITKQFKIFATVVERKGKDLADFETQLAEKGVALQNALGSVKQAEEIIKNDSEQLKKLEDDNSSMLMKITELEEKLDKANAPTNQKRKRERRRSSVALPGSNGLLKPNSSVADFIEEKENTSESTSIAHQVQSRLQSIDEGERNDKAGLDATINEEGDNSAVQKDSRFDRSRRMSLMINPSKTSELAPQHPNTEENKPKVDPSVVKVLEETVQCLRQDLADARSTLEDQSLKIIELEAEAGEKEEFERRLEQTELEKAELNKSLEMAMSQYEKELEDRQKTSDDLRDSVEEMKNEVAIKKDQIEYLQLCLDTSTADVQTLLDEKLELEQQQQNQTVTIEIEGLTKQQMLLKMKNQYESELQRLRDFLTKENHRYLAETRKNLTQHQSDISTIHKGSMQLLRTVNRFKDSIASILEKESLSEAAFEMRCLESLPTDPKFSSSSETKQLLSKMALQATELLVSLENKLSKALLNRRIEVKAAATAKGFILRDLETNVEKLRRARESKAIQFEKYRKLDSLYTSLVKDNQDLATRYKYLEKEMAPYKQLIENHMLLKREMEKLQQENSETLKKNNQLMNEIEKDRAQLERVVKSQQQMITKLSMAKLPKPTVNKNKREQRYAQRTASMFFIAREDQKKNLDRLDQAFKDDQIDSEVHENTVTMINKAMELPRLRLVHLVQRYVAHKKMEMIKQVMKAALVKYKNNIRLTKYIGEMNKRIESKHKKWEARKTELVEYRGAVLLQLMDTISTVKNETGLLLVEPVSKTQHPSRTLRTGKGMLPKAEKQALTPLKETVVGKSMKPQEEIQCTMWQQPDYTGENPPLTMPRILDLDINRWKYTARSTLVGEFNKMKKHEIPKARMEKIRMAYSSKLTLPPIASIYPEHPPTLDE